MSATVCSLLNTAAAFSLSGDNVSNPTTTSALQRPLPGINLASGEFASDRIPGRYGFDYVYPQKATAQPFLNARFKIVRIPILWERLQPEDGHPLDETELRRIDESLAAMNGFSMIILDIHNFGAFKGKKLDASIASRTAFADLWRRLALRFKGMSAVAFGLMNEPNGISAVEARALADAALSAIRRTGATNLVLVPGTRWTGAHSWFSGGHESNAEAFGDFHDPANNFAIELHQYLDADSSGTKSECASANVGVQRLIEVTKWLRTNRQRALLGEFGSSDNAICLDAMDRMLAFMDANADVWMGWTYWAGGGWWGDYFMNIQPTGNEVKPQMRILQKHIPQP